VDGAFLAGLAAAVVLLVWKFGGPAAALNVAGGYVLNTFNRGQRLSSSTLLSSGVVSPGPDALLSQAQAIIPGADLDTLALARMGRSEGVDGMEYRMHVALNDLDYLQGLYGDGVYSSIAALMLHSKVSAADGFFSEQFLGKRYATSDDPYEGDYALAAKVRADHGAGIDPTGGARKFVDKDSFAAQRGVTKTYDDVVAEWSSEGLTARNLPGASSNFVVGVPS
jgi:hypothetical protein